MASTQSQPYACNRTSTVELQFNDNLGNLLLTLACSVSFAIPCWLVLYRRHCDEFSVWTWLHVVDERELGLSSTFVGGVKSVDAAALLYLF